MKFLFVLDSVEAPQAANPQLGRRLAVQLTALGYHVSLLELWDGETPPPEQPASIAVHSLAFPSERRMNAALENGSRSGSPLWRRLLRLCRHPGAVWAAFCQLVLHRPQRTTACRRALERLDTAEAYDVVLAVCAPYRSAFALESAHINAKKVLWQLDPYASNREYTAPGGAEREAKLLCAMHASFVPATSLPDYESGPLADCRAKIHELAFPVLVPSATASTPKNGLHCTFCGSLHEGIRTPSFALALFSALHETQLPALTLTMAGGGWAPFAKEAEAAQKVMGETLCLPGAVPPAQARALMEEADVLLSIGNTADNQLPSKLFEYFGTGKPIVHLCFSETDPCLPFLRRYPLAFVLNASDGAGDLPVAALGQWLSANAARRLNYDKVAALFPDYTPAHVAECFLAGL